MEAQPTHQYRPDDLWKIVIEDLFEDFLHFFLPDAAAAVDWSHEPEFLDKELEALHQESQENSRYVDKLVKVRLHGGRENCLLIHADIQGYHDDAFAERMFIYFYRVFDRYRLPVTALAVFTDDRPGFKPAAYDYQCFGTTLHYSYNIYKILAQDEQALKESENPFALAVLAGLYLLQSGKNEEQRYAYKKTLAQLLFQKRITPQKKRHLLVFLDGLLRIGRQMETRFRQDIEEMAKGDRTNMPIPAHLTNYGQVMYEEGLEKGLEKGLQEGLEKGLQEGLEKGLQKSQQEIARKMLQKGLDIALIAEVTGLTAEEVQKLQH